MDDETLLESWQRDFPRLAQIRAGVPSRESGTFFHGVPCPVRSQLAWEFYEAIEAELASLDDLAWPPFREKLFKCDVKPNRHRGYCGFMSYLTEAKGFRYLGQELTSAGGAYDSILPIAERPKDKSPDWGAYLHGTLVGLLEVKTINESDASLKQLIGDMAKLREQGIGTARRVNPEIASGFWNKLTETVKGARQQLEALEPDSDIPRYVLLVIQPDLEQRLAGLDPLAIASYLEGMNDGLFSILHEIRE